MASRSTAGLGYVSPTRSTHVGENSCIINKADAGPPESHRYYLARRTVLEMLRDRGCVINDSEITRSLADFRSVFGNQPDPDHLRICAPFSSNPSKKILVIFCGPGEINKAKATHILFNIPNKESLHRIIIVLQDKMNHFARTVFDEFQVKVEMFPITELFVNITTHVAAPKHEILTTEEKEQLLKKYELADNKIPYMLATDAIARYYGLEKKQVVKVTYNSNITGSFVTYRYVM
ncbi:DNA-directed RNA polymerase V subunit 5C [Cynara cardunculus var. scolymus]|uniref:DNA-directed RNA polymerase V subunit 5C n=1 Tax=Cynara cardunculus var. scolymus TaxID=59895 RepID=UPI000D62FA9D|nr:DNA-directed RNA polymerase V subunit 5C [Cynara cardunculus var. scolymus]